MVYVQNVNSDAALATEPPKIKPHANDQASASAVPHLDWVWAPIIFAYLPEDTSLYGHAAAYPEMIRPFLFFWYHSNFPSSSCSFVESVSLGTLGSCSFTGVKLGWLRVEIMLSLLWIRILLPVLMFDLLVLVHHQNLWGESCKETLKVLKQETFPKWQRSNRRT